MRLTDKMRTAKARYHDTVADNPLMDPTKLPVSKVAQLAGNQQVNEWMTDPTFADWFYNKDHTRQKLEAVVDVAIDRLREILECPEVGPKGEVTAASQVNAAKLILEFAGYAPAKHKIVEYQDKQIGNMEEAELRAYIAKHMPRQLKAVAGDD